MAGSVNNSTTDGVPYPEACRRLEEAGACVVGLNCTYGPTTMLPLMREIRQACKVRQHTEIVVMLGI